MFLILIVSVSAVSDNSNSFINNKNSKNSISSYVLVNGANGNIIISSSSTTKDSINTLPKANTSNWFIDIGPNT